MTRVLTCMTLLACALLAACKEEEPGTQVMVVIDAEPSVRPRVLDVDVVVTSGEGDVDTWSPRYEMSLTQGSGEVPWPLELALIPRDGDTSRNYLVVAAAHDERGRVIAEVRAISGYVEGRSLSLPLVFDEKCLARISLCDAPLTCRAGHCIDPFVEPSKLLPFTPGQRPGDDPQVAGEGGSGGNGGGESGSGGDITAGSGGDGDGDGDAAIDECADDPEACVPDPMITCDDERCAGCPENFLRLSDDSCSPLLIGLELSHGALSEGLSTEAVRYDIAVPLMTDILSFTPLVPPGVTIELDGEELEGPSFNAGDLPLGESTIVMTLRATGHTSRVYTFTVNRSGRERTFIKAHNTGAGDQFGYAVALQGNTLVIGAPYEDSSSRDKDADNNLRSNSGAAYVMVREDDSYRQAQYLKADPILEGGRLGTAIAIDGDRLAIGAPHEPAGGSVYIWRRDGSQYVFEQRVTATPSDGDRNFGAAIALKDGVLAVGAPGDNAFATGCGAIYLHTLSGTTWTQEDPIGPDAPAPWEFFGSSVALQGDALFVGATGESNDLAPRGALYVLARRSGRFVEVQRITEPDAGVLDFFGESVAVEGDTLVVGAFGASGAAEGSGSIYIYEPNSDQLWERKQRIGASNPGTYAGFGLRLALIGNLLVTGAPTDDSGARGINGDLSVDGVVDSGGGYVFSRTGSIWSQLARIKSDLPEIEDLYGCGVAAEGDTIVFGATGESSTATDVDGDPAMNGAKASGAVYVVR